MADGSYHSSGAMEKAKPPYDGSTLGSEGSQEVVPATVGYKGKDDPFGDESNSAVKYKTMAWWQVRLLPPSLCA